MVTTITEVIDFDVEDIIRSRAISQARAVQFVNIAKGQDSNAVSAARTLPSGKFEGTMEELPE